ncbi:MAG: thiamine pyrophosphate-dependent enzyme [Bacteriovoracales bacterium]|nr:thiamine pyrophosphate-dependent enzyme [Bacteriovoracales bacterium]
MPPSKPYTIGKTDPKTLLQWYELLVLGRLLDDRAANYLKQAIGWSYHAPYAGHDAIQLAIGQIFDRKTDHLYPYYRDMMTVLSAGLTAEEIILNGISKATDGASGGRHMSNHFAKPSWNIHNVSSCTGNHASQAVGTARAMKYYGHKGVSISSQGESSISEGYCYEAINGASCELLPVIFVLQDNGYGISVPKSDQTANERISDNFSGFKNLRLIQVDGLDVLACMNALAEAKEHALSGKGPVIVDALCVRMGPHSNSDRHELYRDEKELAQAKAKDPLKSFERELIKARVLDDQWVLQIQETKKKELLEAHKKAMKAPDPDPATIFDFVVPKAYKSPDYPEGLHDKTGDKMSFIDALNSTLKAEFRHNPETFIWGQDMANKEKGGIFNVTKGMQQEFGKERVFNAPIAEDYIMATANGMSRFRDDIRIVVEGAEFADYFWPAIEQLVDSSHDYWRSNGAFAPNVTVRLASGGYIGGGLYHSQSIEATLCTFPGIRVVYPSFADDAAGLLRTSIRSKGLTMFLEPKFQYNNKSAHGIVPDDFTVPFGKARLRRRGKDLSIICWGNVTHLCLQVAEDLAKENIELEVLDLRSLNPLDEEAICQTVQNTNRALIVHEDKMFGGFGGEVCALINEKVFEHLDAPVRRIGATFTPVGFHRILEKAILPNAQDIAKAARSALQY